MRHTGRFQDSRLTESSGAALSRTQPGILWTLNDSGDGPYVYVTDTLGQQLGRFALQGAENRDWEEIALGPCPAGQCLYVADTGDNYGRRAFVRIYRVPEPSAADTRPDQTVALPGVQVLRFSYPDGARDVEAMFVAPDGAIHLVSKGTFAAVRHYRLSAAAWNANGMTVAQPVAMLPVTRDPLRRHLVTGAAIAPDGHRVAVRTYREIYRFELTRDGALVPASPPRSCDIAGLDPQGEGIDWLGDDDTLVLTSERGIRSPGQVTLLRCGEGGASR